MTIRGDWYCGMEVPPKMPNFILEEHMAKQLEVIVSNPYMLISGWSLFRNDAACNV